jgi:hypothetical protein
MTARIAVVAAVCTGLISGDAIPLKVVRELRVGSTRDVVLIGSVDEDYIEKKALEVLGSGEVTMGRLLAYPNEKFGRVLFRQSQTSCIPQTLAAFLKINDLPREPLLCPRVYEAIKIGGDIVLRAVGPDCVTSARVIQGTSNPLNLSLDGAEHEVVDISVGVAPRSREVWGREYARIAVFVRTKTKPDAASARNVLLKLKKMSGARDALVVMRQDFAFGAYCDFLEPYLFGGQAFTLGSQELAPKSTFENVCVSLYPHPAQCWANYDAP